MMTPRIGTYESHSVTWLENLGYRLMHLNVSVFWIILKQQVILRFIMNIEVKRLYLFQKETSDNNIFWRSRFKHLQQRWGESFQCCCFSFLLHDLKYVVCDDFIVHRTDGDEQDIFRSYLIPQTCKIIFATLHKL